MVKKIIQIRSEYTSARLIFSNLEHRLKGSRFKRHPGYLPPEVDYRQPIEVSALIDALHEAYLTTEDSYFIKKMDWVYNWLLGNNDLGATLF